MKYFILLLILFFISLTTINGESNCNINLNNLNVTKNYHPWKPMCFYMNETVFNQTVNTEKCYEIIDFIFNETAMRNKLERSMNLNHLQCSIVNLMANNC